MNQYDEYKKYYLGEWPSASDLTESVEPDTSVTGMIAQYMKMGMTRAEAKNLLFAYAYGAGSNKPLMAIDPGIKDGSVVVSGDYVEPSKAADETVSAAMQKRIQRLMASAVEDAKTIRDLKEQIKTKAQENELVSRALREAKKVKELHEDDRELLSNLRDQISEHEIDNRQLMQENNRLRALAREAGLE